MANEIGVSLKVDGEKEFKKAISDINQDVKLLTNEMKLVTEQFKKSASSEEALKEKSRVLTEQISTQQTKIAKLKEALANAEQEFGENSKQANNWRNSLLQAETQLAKYNNELDDVTQQLNEYGNEANDAQRATKETGDAMKDAKGGADAFTSGISSLTVAMGNLIADVLRKAATELVDFAKKGIELASDLQEVQNVVDTVFGGGAQDIYAWAQTASTSFGLTSLQAQQFAGRIGAGLKAMGITSEAALNDMSITLAGLAGDLASFYNLSADETYTKIFSGVVSGETEGLKALGVVMTETNLKAFAMQQGIQKSWKEMTAAEKATLRYQYLLYATSDAQGDFARTSDSYANQAKILQMNLDNLAATIGEAILPLVTDVISGMNDFITRLTEAYGEGGLQGLLNEAMSMLGEFLQSVADMAPELAQLAVQLILALVESLTSDDNLSKLVNAGITLIANLIVGLLDALPDLVRACGDLAYEAAAAFTDPDNLKNFVTAGKAIASSIWDGITALLNGTIFGQFIQGLITGGLPGALGNTAMYVLQGGGNHTSYTYNISPKTMSSGVIDRITAQSQRITTITRATD